MSYKIFPNPSPGQISIEMMGSSDAKCLIFTLDGRLVQRCQLVQDQTKIFLDEGIYLLKIEAMDSIFVEKVVVAK